MVACGGENLSHITVLPAETIWFHKPRKSLHRENNQNIDYRGSSNSSYKIFRTTMKYLTVEFIFQDISVFNTTGQSCPSQKLSTTEQAQYTVSSL